jgi:uncharacterized membrane protein
MDCRQKLAIMLLLFLLSAPLLSGEDNRQPQYQAEIIKVSFTRQAGRQRCQLITAVFRTGPYRGRTARLINELNGYPTDIRYRVGHQILVQEMVEGASSRFVIAGPVRADTLYLLTMLFVLSVVLLAGWQGIRSIVSLGLTLMVIFYLLVPAVLRGVDPVKVTLVLASLSTVLTIFLVGGVNRKTVAAVIGTVSGVLAAGYLAWYFGERALLTGYSDETAQMLGYTVNAVNFKGLLFSGIIMGALGAIMDIAVSIASTINELKQSNPQIGFQELIGSGFRVGRDAIGTMVNTLILAYVGGSFPLLMLYQMYRTPFGQIVNSDATATEIVRMLAGSIGLWAAVPATVVSAALFCRE